MIKLDETIVNTLRIDADGVPGDAHVQPDWRPKLRTALEHFEPYTRRVPEMSHYTWDSNFFKSLTEDIYWFVTDIDARHAATCHVAVLRDYLEGLSKERNDVPMVHFESVAAFVKGPKETKAVRYVRELALFGKRQMGITDLSEDFLVMTIYLHTHLRSYLNQT